VAFPVYWLALTSVKIGKEVATFPPVFIPSTITFENYIQIFQTEGALQFLSHSVVVSTVSTALTILLGALAAFSLAQRYLRFHFRQGLLVLFLMTRIFPPITTAIPYYIIMRGLNLIDTQTALILVYVAYGLPFVIWLLLGFFQEIPSEIDQAATVDGCGLLQRFFVIDLPLVLPGLAVAAIFAFIYAWNEFLYASILTSFNARTLPVQIASFISDRYLLWGEMSAMGTMMMVPVVIFAAAAQRYLVRGLTFGAVKA